MGDASVGILAFNRGRVSPKALARVDIRRMAFSADVQTNAVPRVLGSMSLRPGLEYIGATDGNNAAKYIEFIRAADDTALIEVTASKIRVWVDETVITRGSVSTTFSNGLFTSNITGWTDNSAGSASIAFVTGGYLGLTGTGTAQAIADEQVTVASGDQNAAHSVKIIVNRGPVTLRIGSTQGDDDYVSERTLRTGELSFKFTPSGDFHVRFISTLKRVVRVDSIAVESSGAMELTAPWAAADLSKLRWTQSADVIFVACEGYQQRRIERHGTNSWAVVKYEPEDGPYRLENVSPTTLTPGALSGNTTLTASVNFFKSTQVGALFRLASSGQTVEQANITAQNTFSNSIKITGVTASRIFTIILTADVWAGASVVTLQRSLDVVGNWEDVSGKTFTAATTETFDDGLDNQVVHYRIGIKTGDYNGSDDVTVKLTTGIGSIVGVGRVTGFTSKTVVDIEIITDFGDVEATDNWREGIWSSLRGFPTATALAEGRLWWVGRDRFIGSVTDAFDVFDPDTEGDSGPINRTFGAGPVDIVNWLLPLQRLIAGTAGAEVSARSTSLDEPLTPSQFNLKDASTEGSAKVPAVKIDTNGVFVQVGGTRVYELSNNFEANDYVPTDLTDIVPEIGEPGIIRMGVQRQPDTRLHCIRSDGTVGMLIRELANEVLCWLDIETDGTIEDVVVLPGTVENKVYYLVKRTINGSTVRYLEKWALESETVGGTLNKQADSFATFTNPSPAASVPAGTCSHLVGEIVVVWADGLCLTDSDGDIATFTVASDGSVIGLIHEGAAYSATTGIVGLAYRGRFESTKLAYASQLGTALTQRKRLTHLGMVMANTHAQGLKYGPTFETMDNLPLIEEGAVVDSDTIHAEYDMDMFEWPGGWGTDERMCLEMNAPRPVTIMGVVVSLEETDKK